MQADDPLRPGASALRLSDLIVLFALALLVRGGAALVVGEPPYLDPAYYELVARRLASGEGFSVPVLWSFLDVGGRLPVDPTLPIPSNRHWMPLTSIVSALPMLATGPSRLAAQMPMIVLSAALVPLTAFVTWELTGSRRSIWVAGALALFAGPMLVLAPQIDNFAVFGVAGFGAIYAAMRCVRAEGAVAGRWLVASGALCGLATLARIDGLLLIVAPIAAWAVRRREPAISVSWLAGAVLAAVVVLSPWLVRQIVTFGAPFPSAGGNTLWITSYNEQFSISRDLTPGTYLELGVPAIIGSKLAAWGTLLGRTAVLLGGTYLASFAYGMWAARRQPDLGPFLAYWLAMFAAMGGVFTFHAPQGAFYHSAPAWLPFAIALSVRWFRPMTAAIGTRWRLLARPRNQRFLAVAAVIGAVVLSLIGSTSLVIGWQRDRALLDEVVPFLSSAERADDIVMYVDPPSLSLATGNRAIAPPFDPFPVIGEAARAYGVRWLLLERPAGASSDVLGLWEGAEAMDADGNRATWLADDPAFDGDGVRVYEVVP